MSRLRLAIVLGWALSGTAPPQSQTGWPSPRIFESNVAFFSLEAPSHQFYLKTVPYGNGYPLPYGLTTVNDKADDRVVYTLADPLGILGSGVNQIFLSNDGRFVIVIMSTLWSIDESAVIVYRDGVRFHEFSEAAITGCDYKVERCSYRYTAIEFNGTTKRFDYRPNATESERHLSDAPVFSDGERVYVVDSKKQAHVFSLATGEREASEAFDVLFPRVSPSVKASTPVVDHVPTPYIYVPHVTGGRSADDALADALHMVALEPWSKVPASIAVHQLWIDGMLYRDGRFEVERAFSVDGAIAEGTVRSFFAGVRLDSSVLPARFDRWYLTSQPFWFRNSDLSSARKEKREDDDRKRREAAARATAERLGDTYIPRDLGECMTELDKMLAEPDKADIRSLPDREGVIAYHHSLGINLRNEWGLWAGSRLSMYFVKLGVRHPDSMSHVILVHYHDWLHGSTTTWKDWERSRRHAELMRKVFWPLSAVLPH